MAKKRKVKRKIKVKNPSPEVESGEEFQDTEDNVGAAKKITTRKFKVPKPESLQEQGDENTLSEGEGEVELAPLDPTKVQLGKKKKRKIKRKK